MKGLVIRWCVSALSLILTASILPGVEVGGVFSAFVAAAFLGIVNAFIRPLLILITLPLNILTLGLFTLIINGLMLLLVGSVIKGVEIHGFGWAVLGALILGVINWAITSLISERGDLRVIDLKKGTDGTWEA